MVNGEGDVTRAEAELRSLEQMAARLAAPTPQAPVAVTPPDAPPRVGAAREGAFLAPAGGPRQGLGPVTAPVTAPPLVPAPALAPGASLELPLGEVLAVQAEETRAVSGRVDQLLGEDAQVQGLQEALRALLDAAEARGFGAAASDADFAGIEDALNRGFDPESVQGSRIRIAKVKVGVLSKLVEVVQRVDALPIPPLFPNAELQDSGPFNQAMDRLVGILEESGFATLAGDLRFKCVDEVMGRGIDPDAALGLKECLERMKRELHVVAEDVKAAFR